MIETPVLIVGGGPVGMALGLLLNRFGVDHLIVERRPTTTEHPKARGLTARSMEHFRVWGLERRLTAGGLGAGAEPDATALGWVQYFCESVTGRVLGVTNPEPSINSPVAKRNVAQDVIEQVLADALVGNRHTEVRRETEFLGFTQTGTGVIARIRQQGTEAEVRARYLVACDGAASPVRAALGLSMAGPGTLAHMASYYYRADTSHLPHARRVAAFSIFPADPATPAGVFLAADSSALRWLYLQRLDGEDQELLTEDELVPILRRQWGLPDLDVKLVTALKWRMAAEVPAAIRSGPVLLAGDAAHCIPPTGGMGLNTGLQDAHNLAWKLAMVLGGVAPDGLLDSYDAERRPVATRIMDWSVGNHARLTERLPNALRRRDEDVQGWRDTLLDMNNHTHAEGHAMGYVYERGALVDDGSPLPPHDPRHYWPTDRPGARFPHVWLDGDATQSTIDWFDTAFVLVCGPAATAWRLAGHQLAGGPVPLEIRTLPWMAGPFSFAEDGAVLVRPDGHVAWRPGEVAGKPAALGAALASILSGGQRE